MIAKLHQTTIKLAVCHILLLQLVLAGPNCSPWTQNWEEINETCMCIPNIQEVSKYFSCTKNTISSGICLTKDMNEDHAVIGLCPYVTGITDISSLQAFGQLHFSEARTVQLDELNDLMCGPLNRQGLLCSKCKQGYGPAVHAFGFMCADCDQQFSGWGLYLFLQLFPLTIFYAIVIIFHVRAASPPLISFVLFCQVYLQTERSNVFVRTYIQKFSIPVLYKIAQTLCGFWNLDFFRHIIPPFCVDSRLNNIHALWLDFISALYPLFLILITYTAIELHAHNFKPVIILWRPFHNCCVRIRRGIDPKSSIANALATFLILSIGKIIFLSVHSVYKGSIHHVIVNANTTARQPFYYQPEMEFQEISCAIAILIVSFFLFVFLPMIFLCLYPTKIFRKLLKCFRLDRPSLRIFLEVFQGHFKDGTSGTLDYRLLSGVYILLQFFTSISYFETLTRQGYVSYGLHGACLVVLILFAITQPYKSKWNNYLTFINFVLIQLVVFGYIIMLPSCGCDNEDETRLCYFSITILNIILLLPHTVLYAYEMYKTAKNLGWTKHLTTSLKNTTFYLHIKSLLKGKRKNLTDYNQLEGLNEESLPDRLESPQYYN